MYYKYLLLIHVSKLSLYLNIIRLITKHTITTKIILILNNISN